MLFVHNCICNCIKCKQYAITRVSGVQMDVGGKNRKDPINLFPLKFLSISCGMNASGAVLTVCLNHKLKFLTHNLHRKKASSFLKAKR